MSSYSFAEELRKAQQNARKQLEFPKEEIKMQVSIALEDYSKMMERLAWLDALEAAGVDNWEGISYAREIYAEDNPELDEDHPDSEEN